MLKKEELQSPEVKPAQVVSQEMQRAIALVESLKSDLEKSAIKGKDVDHKRTIKNGGSNEASNLRLRSVAENRSDGGKSGSRAGKSAGARKGALSQ